jgi:hypothetical protein
MDFLVDGGRRRHPQKETSRLETPEELQLHHNHEKFLF